ncbi:MAG: hypothetical protein ACI4SB_01665 [Acutalibacteraceae bacterium]
MTVTFFGHRNVPQAIQPALETVLINLIEYHAANRFYVGNQGKFDSITAKTLQTLKIQYSHIDCAIVLAYIPDERKKSDEGIDTIIPDGFEFWHPKYAILKRNQWMIEQSDVVITYVVHTHGGAAQFKELALKKGKVVIELSDLLLQK